VTSFSQILNWPKTRAVAVANLPLLLIGHALVALPDALVTDFTALVILAPSSLLIMAWMEAVVFLRTYRSLTTSGAIQQLNRNLGRFLWASVATAFWILVGAALLILPMFYFMAKMALAIPVSVAESKVSDRPVQASQHLTRGLVFPVAVIQAGLILIPFVIQMWAPHWSISLPFAVLAGVVSTSFVAALADSVLKSPKKP
jgi:hypothetical protein